MIFVHVLKQQNLKEGKFCSVNTCKILIKLKGLQQLQSLMQTFRILLGKEITD